jgi:hypothetical protein
MEARWALRGEKGQTAPSSGGRKPLASMAICHGGEAICHGGEVGVAQGERAEAITGLA